MKKAWPLVTLGIVAYLVLAAVTLPANVVLSRLENPNLSTAGVSGTLWKGRAQVLRVSGADLGSAQWDLHVLALFTGRLKADVELKRTDGFAKTLFTATPSERLAFENLAASIPLTALPAQWVRAGTGGTINLKFGDLRIEDRWPVHADGAVELIDVSLPDLKGATGSYKVVFPPDAAAGNTLAGALSDLGGPLQVTGTVQLSRKERRVLVQGMVAPRPDAPQNLVKQLEFLGPPDAEGRRSFTREDTL